MRSFYNHFKRFSQSRNQAMDTVLALKVRARLDRIFNISYRIPDDFLSFSHFMRVVEKLDYQSSPGYPYMLTNPTNSSLFKVDGLGRPSLAACRMVYAKVMFNIDNRISDPIRVFVKGEAIPDRKLEEHRYRLISAVSVVDQIIDHMLFGEFNNEITQDWTRTPVKVGWSPFGGGWKYVPIAGVVSTDKSSWDWTVTAWLFEEILQLRFRKCLNLTDQFVELCEWRFRKLFAEPEFIFSNGLMLRQTFVGIMKSGCVNTIVDNSIMQVILDQRINEELSLPDGVLWVMGDDVLQDERDGSYYNRLSELCFIKEITRKAKFAGMQFKPNGVVIPEYYQRHAYNLLHSTQDDELLGMLATSYSLLYHRSDERKDIPASLESIARYPSKGFLQAVYDF